MSKPIVRIMNGPQGFTARLTHGSGGEYLGLMHQPCADAPSKDQALVEVCLEAALVTTGFLAGQPDLVRSLAVLLRGAVDVQDVAAVDRGEPAPVIS